MEISTYVEILALISIFNCYHILANDMNSSNLKIKCFIFLKWNFSVTNSQDISRSFTTVCLKTPNNVHIGDRSNIGMKLASQSGIQSVQLHIHIIKIQGVKPHKVQNLNDHSKYIKDATEYSLSLIGKDI